MVDDYEAMRESKRVRIVCRVRYGDNPELEFEGEVKDLSDSGLCIESHDLYDKGTKLKMVVSHVGTEYKAEGEVMWSVQVPKALEGVRKYGMGVRFTQVDEALLELYWKR